MNTELANIKAFFTPRRKKCLRVSAIEKEADLPPKTLDHFLQNRRTLNSEHLDKLIPVLVDLGFKPEAEQIL